MLLLEPVINKEYTSKKVYNPADFDNMKCLPQYRTFLLCYLFVFDSYSIIISGTLVVTKVFSDFFYIIYIEKFDAVLLKH
jgi:hypothetical protein